ETRPLSAHLMSVLFPPATPPPPSSTLFPYTTLFRSQPRRRGHTECSADLAALLPARRRRGLRRLGQETEPAHRPFGRQRSARRPDRKSTRLNSSHVAISYAVFCLKKKNNKQYKGAEL